jgi:hypothetical protein
LRTPVVARSLRVSLLGGAVVMAAFALSAASALATKTANLYAVPTGGTGQCGCSRHPCGLCTSQLLRPGAQLDAGLNAIVENEPPAHLAELRATSLYPGGRSAPACGREEFGGARSADLSTRTRERNTTRPTRYGPRVSSRWLA